LSARWGGQSRDRLSRRQRPTDCRWRLAGILRPAVILVYATALVARVRPFAVHYEPVLIVRHFHHPSEVDAEVGQIGLGAPGVSESRHNWNEPPECEHEVDVGERIVLIAHLGDQGAIPMGFALCVRHVRGTLRIARFHRSFINWLMLSIHRREELPDLIAHRYDHTARTNTDQRSRPRATTSGPRLDLSKLRKFLVISNYRPSSFIQR
jgi:hypothetical protein